MRCAHVYRGVDLLFCGHTHRLKKIILHTNLPNHASFGTYSKCHFAIQAASPVSATSPEAATDCELNLNQSSRAWQPAAHQQHQPDTLSVHSMRSAQLQQLSMLPAGHPHKRNVVAHDVSGVQSCSPRQQQPLQHQSDRGLSDQQLLCSGQPQGQEDYRKLAQPAEGQQRPDHLGQQQQVEDDHGPQGQHGQTQEGLGHRWDQARMADEYSVLKQQGQLPVQQWLSQTQEGDGAGSLIPADDAATSASAADTMEQVCLSQTILQHVLQT